MHKQFRRNLMAMAVASALWGASGMASAAGFALIEQSASGMGNAFAGAAATSEDASAMWFNPASMSKLQGGMQFTAGGHLIDLSAEFHNSGGSSNPVALGNPGGGNGGDAGGMSPIGNFYFVAPIGDQLHFGVGVNTPFGLKTEYDDNWIGRFQGIKSDLATINVNPAISFKVNDTFSVGVGLDYQFIDAELTNAIVAGPGNEGRAKLKADDSAWGWNAGVLIEPVKGTRIGASYRSKIDYTLDGTASATSASGATIADNPVHGDITMPESFSISLAQALGEKWEFLADATFTKWSAINRVNVLNSNTGATVDTLVLDFDDSWRYSVGVNYKLNDGWKLRAGVALDQTPVKDATTRTVRMPDNDRTWVSFGAQVKIKETGRLDFGYAHLFIKDADINNTRDQTGFPIPGAATSHVVGTYEGSVNIFSMTYSMAF
ncbi:MAG TPA: outer membrane protein transport protein [Burkholderiales bacterium]|nr:outer membrane protein transport protein [Burkholderiales bacterium]